MKYLLLALLLCGSFSASCAKIKIERVNKVDVNKYSGTWFEIARLPNYFERKCIENVTATYSLRKDGGINVVNKCLWGNKVKTSVGRAYFREKSNIGSLKVTFFWPFYGGYNIAVLDKNYQYALVIGDNPHYLWILSRSKTLQPDIIKELLEKGSDLGFDVSKIMYVRQN